MLDLTADNPDRAIMRTVEFAEIDIGDKFITDRWMWEKVDPENAMALDELMGRSGHLLGTVFHFQPWSKVAIDRTHLASGKA